MRHPGRRANHGRRVQDPGDPDAGYEHTWDALAAMGDLFRTAATEVARSLNLDYPALDDSKVTGHLEHVRRLPRDAQAMY